MIETIAVTSTEFVTDKHMLKIEAFGDELAIVITDKATRLQDTVVIYASTPVMYVNTRKTMRCNEIYDL